MHPIWTPCWTRFSRVSVDGLSPGGTPRGHWLPVTAVLALLVAGLPLWSWYVRRALDGSDEPLGVIALVAALVTIVTAARLGHHDRARLRLRPWPMLAGAVLLGWLQWSGAVRLPLVAGLLAVAVLAASLVMPRGKAGVVALLVLSLPLVATLDFYAGYPLRWAAAVVSQGTLNAFGLGVGREGVVLMDGSRAVGVDPPCAGIRMLWTSCFVAAVVAARLRLSWRRTLGLLGWAAACAVAGNGLRAAVVFFPESGRVNWPEWAHPAAGLVVHAAVLAAVFRAGYALDHAGRRCESTAWWRAGRRVLVVGAVVALPVALLFLVLDPARAGQAKPNGKWPATFDGTPLLEVPVTSTEKRFANVFPGQIGRFEWGEGEVILRRTTRATRMMHPAGDCYRAAGFEVNARGQFLDSDGRHWGCSVVRKEGRSWKVLERYVNADGSLVATDASAWFWLAFAHPERGPWTAITIRLPEVADTAAAVDEV